MKIDGLGLTVGSDKSSHCWCRSCWSRRVSTSRAGRTGLCPRNARQGSRSFLWRFRYLLTALWWHRNFIWKKKKCFVVFFSLKPNVRTLWSSPWRLLCTATKWTCRYVDPNAPLASSPQLSSNPLCWHPTFQALAPPARSSLNKPPQKKALLLGGWCVRGVLTIQI